MQTNASKQKTIKTKHRKAYSEELAMRNKGNKPARLLKDWG